MQTTLIITMAAIFLTWLYIQQKRLAAYERYCMDAYRKTFSVRLYNVICAINEAYSDLGESAKQAAESFAKIKNSIENQPTVSK